jgi:hypothetical protein
VSASRAGLVVVTAIVAVLPHAADVGARAAKCKRPAGAAVVRSNHEAALYERTDRDTRSSDEVTRLWGCVSRVGRTRLLIRAEVYITGQYIEQVRLAGTYVAFVRTTGDQYDYSTAVLFGSLRRPDRLHVEAVSDTGSGPLTRENGGPSRVAMLRPTAWGAVAYSERIVQDGTGRRLAALHVYSRGQSRRLGRSETLDPYSFRWTDRTISWTDGGAPQRFTVR